MDNIKHNGNERIDDLGIKNLKIIQNKEYFCFGTDSVLLANFVSSNSSKNNIIDFCSGSGVIPVIISAKKKCNKIIAVELQRQMYDLLKRNVLYNTLDEKIITLNEDIKNVQNIRKKMIKELGEGTADIIVCNPPYKKIGEGIKNTQDVKYIARHEVCCKLEDIFNSASKLLNTKGKLYIVHKPERLTDLICIARKYRLEAKKIKLVQPSLNLKPSIVLIEYVKDGNSEVIVEKPLIEYDENGNFTNEFLKIYE